MDQNITLRLNRKNLDHENEIDYYQYLYEVALYTMLRDKTPESIQAFTEANARLYEVQDSYRIAARLLLEHKRDQLPPNSQHLHTL